MVRKTKLAAPPVAEQIREAAFKDGRIEMVPIDAVKAYDRNARTHDEKQTAVIMASMREFGFVNPVLVDADNMIVAGHGRVEAARRLGIKHVPVLRIAGLTPDQLRAYSLADNRIAELAGWDEDILAIELQYLVELDGQIPIEVLGWNSAEIDIKLDALGSGGDDPATEEIPALERVAVSEVGDLWLLGRHRLLCGSALVPANYDLLLPGEQVDFVCQDPPWNIKINSIVGSGKTQFREFVMGSGEMSDAGFRQFLYDQLACNRDRARPGAIIQVFIDWRGVEKVTLYHALLMKELEMAIGGDWRARKTILELGRWALPEEAPVLVGEAESGLQEADEAIIKWYEGELRARPHSKSGQ